MTKKEIIDNVLTATELTANEFAMACGIIPTTLFMALSRDTLSKEIIKKIHAKFNVRKQYLQTGEGEIFDKKRADVGESLPVVIVPREENGFISKQVFDVIIKANENERKTLVKLSRNYEVVIQLMEEEAKKFQQTIKELEVENEGFQNEIISLRKENNVLLLRISTQKQSE
jgi:hypothetical protein